MSLDEEEERIKTTWPWTGNSKPNVEYFLRKNKIENKIQPR
jgi:hypothetical protein